MTPIYGDSMTFDNLGAVGIKNFYSLIEIENSWELEIILRNLYKRIQIDTRNQSL